MANTRSWLLAAAAALLILAVVIGTGQTDELEAAKVEKRSAGELDNVLRALLDEDEAFDARELGATDDDAIADEFARQLLDSSSEDSESSEGSSSSQKVSKKFFGRVVRFGRRVIRRICRYRRARRYCRGRLG